MLPERYGCDVLWRAQDAWWGVQRKELADFVASIQDGRLAREVAMMKPLPLKVVALEGRIMYTSDDMLTYSRRAQSFTRAQFEGFIMSLMEKGVHVVHTTGTQDTARWIKLYAQWTAKPRHASLERRPGPVSPWGHITDEDWAIHFLQGFDGLGSEKAKAIIKHFKGVPLQWTVTEKQLMEVPGIGKGMARKMMNALDHSISISSDSKPTK